MSLRAFYIPWKKNDRKGWDYKRGTSSTTRIYHIANTSRQYWSEIFASRLSLWQITSVETKELARANLLPIEDLYCNFN